MYFKFTSPKLSPLLSSLLFLLSIFLLHSCDNEEQSNNDQLIEVQIDFETTVGTDPFKCGQSYTGIGKTESEIAFTDLRYYIYNVVLVTESGQAIEASMKQDEIWQRGNVALLDFEDGCENGNTPTNTSISVIIPNRVYTGLSFSVGLPMELNTPETVLENRGSPLNLGAMFWSWKSGYKYLRLDSNLPFFRVHLGANACTDNFNCTEPNLATFEFEDFDYNTEKVSLDLELLLSDSDLTQNTEGTAPGCMGQGDDPDCQAVFRHFNLAEGNDSAFSIKTK